MLIGLWRPSILVPEWVMQSPQRRAILAHELAHLKRLDLLWNWLPTLALALLPLHPLVWIGNRQWHLATESACDATAVRTTNVDPVAYVRMLINAATAPPSCRSSVLALAVAAESSWCLKRRVKLMQSITSWSRRRLIVAGLMLGVFVLAAAVPWRVVAQNPPTTMPAQAYKPPPVLMNAPPATAPAASHSEFTGIVSTTTDVLRTATGGAVAKIEASVGQSVKRGDILVEMDRTVAEAELNEAKAKQEYANQDVANMKQAYQAATVAAGDLRLAESQLEVAQTQLVRAQHELDALRIVAPFDGIVIECKVQPGDVLEPHQAVATVLQTGAPQVELYAELSTATRLKLGMPATIELNVLGKSRISALGKVKWIAPFMEPGTQAQKVIIQMTTSPPELIPGTHVAVSLSPSE
jgi:RND family efflux transporter MFP subunit